jgi:hypothetical protein
MNYAPKAGSLKKLTAAINYEHVYNIKEDDELPGEVDLWKPRRSMQSLMD